MKPLYLVALLAAGCVTGCAALDAASVGRTDRLGPPPFVLHYATAPTLKEAVVLSPVALDQVTMRDVLAPAQVEVFAELAAAMDARLATMDCCQPAATPLPDNGAPLVYVGSAEGATAPPGAETFRERWDKYPPMVIHLDKPGDAWVGRLPREPGAPAFLWIRLALVDYPLSEAGRFGKKIVLGEGHELPRPFVTAELQPMQVLQVTGALLAPDGRVLAAGAEGIFAVETRFSAQVFGLQREIDPDQVKAVLQDLRRADLPGNPLNWEAALDTLVARLLHSQ
jgi:hypothetical protein